LALGFNQIFVLKNQEVWLADPQRIVVTNTNPLSEILLGLIAAFWSQNLKKPFESAVTAAFIAKIWQENFSKISELPKAINLAEKEII
jgi:NAD(P)H-hydrate repair Nnr-like enzyme with NAD(P)H-hydrate dehydratase domain